MHRTQALSEALVKKIDPTLVKELLAEYNNAKSAYWLSDVTKALIHAGTFCDIAISCVLNIFNSELGKDLNRIHFDGTYNEISKLTKNMPKNADEELLFVAIPAVLKSTYTVRNKKKGAHFKLNKAEEIDAQIVITSCNWVMSQFIALYYTKNQTEVENIINALMERKIPTIETFEDGKMMIIKKLGFSDEILLLLYHTNKRMKTDDLNSILRPKEKSYISTYLARLFKDKLVHCDESGAMITKKGIAEIESNANRFFS